MTIRQLTQTLNELPPEFTDHEVVFGHDLSERHSLPGWTDRGFTAVYAHPDRGEVVLCSHEVGQFLADSDKREYLRLIPVFRKDPE